MNQVYDFKRIMLLARLKLNLHKKALVLSILGYFGLLLIIGFFIAYAGRNNTEEIQFFEPFHYISLSIMMVLGSWLFASRSFQDMNTPEKSITQILVPASSFEKFILPLISTSIIWLIFSFAIYHVFSLIFNCAWVCAFGYDFKIFNGFQVFKVPYLIEIMMGMALIHSMFLLGAATFRKYPILKTLLASNILQWAYSILAMIVIIILFGSMENFGQSMDSFDQIIEQKEWFQAMVVNGKFDPKQLEYKVRYFWRFMGFLLTIALYVTAYFKLKEREV